MLNNPSPFSLLTSTLWRMGGERSKVITDYIPIGGKNAISRAELSRVSGIPDRRMRNEIAQARRYIPILNLQNGEGYYIPDMNEDEDVEALKRFLEQETHRLKSIGWSLRGARRCLNDKIHN